jgi:hypothetical protein
MVDDDRETGVAKAAREVPWCVSGGVVDDGDGVHDPTRDELPGQ